MATPSRAELEAKGVDELRAMVRQQHAGILTGPFGVRINKDQCIDVLAGHRSAEEVREEVAKAMMQPPRPQPKMPPIKQQPAQAAVVQHAPVTPHDAALAAATVAAPSKTTHPASPAASPATPMDFQAMLQQQIRFEAEKLVAAERDAVRAELDASYSTVIDDLKRQLTQVQAQPTIVPVEEGQMVKIGGKEYTAIGGPTDHVPALDPLFDVSAWRSERKVRDANRRFILKFPELMTAILNGYTIWLAGPPGCGKTTVVEYICASLGWPVIKVVGNKDASIDDFIGTWTVVDGATVWIDGPLTTAMKIGAVFLADEVGLFPSECTNVMHTVAERNARGSLTLTSKGGDVVHPHPNFRIIATDNSMGFGDQSGLYPDMRVQSAAFLDRFTFKLTVSYPSPAKERDILVAKAGITPELAELMVKIANDTRDAQAEERMVYAISTRKLVNWADVSAKFDDVAVGFATVILNSVPESDEAVLVEIAQRHLGDKLGGEFNADAAD